MNEKLAGFVVLRGVFWGPCYAKRFCIRRGLPTSLFNPIFGSIEKLMDRKITQTIIGGPAIDPEIHEFIQVALRVPMRTGDRLTEECSGNIISPGDIRPIKPRTVGGLLINAEVWLEPIDGFDDPNAGEIMISWQCVTSDYLNNEKASNELFLDASRTAIRTDDVAKWDEDGCRQIVDRIRSIFKLSLREYVSAELVTQVFEAPPIVKLIFMYGDSKSTCIVTMVAPNQAVVAAVLEMIEINHAEFAQAGENRAVKKAVLAQLANAEAGKGKLFGVQVVSAVHLKPIESTIANEFVSPICKLKRKKLTEKYRAAIEDLYTQV